MKLTLRQQLKEHKKTFLDNLHSKTMDAYFEKEKVLIQQLRKNEGKFAEYRKKRVHRTHKMNKWHTEPLAPCGTPRWYAVRECSLCDAGEAHHAAGHFIDDEIYKPCKGAKS